jgi:hypothetical protein
MRTVRIGSLTATASDVLRSYWVFASERQRVYYSRLNGRLAPWTDDPVISRYRFTNAYRAADRVSQDLIRVVYGGSQQPEDVLLRVLLFRFFNKPSTWAALEQARGVISWQDFAVEDYSRILDGMLARGERVYSAAYIVPPPPFGAVRKHRNHLLLVQHMMNSGLCGQLARARSLQAVFNAISSFPSLGPFLAYQLTIDLNYSILVDFDEDDFVAPGPGARSGITKCFPDTGGVKAEEIIRWMTDTQEEQLDYFGQEFQDLFGRRLKLIDCQNLFCETDKYARVVHPSSRGVGNRSRIKQQFVPSAKAARPFFPPKWGINGNVGKDCEPYPQSPAIPVIRH